MVKKRIQKRRRTKRKTFYDSKGRRYILLKNNKRHYISKPRQKREKKEPAPLPIIEASKPVSSDELGQVMKYNMIQKQRNEMYQDQKQTQKQSQSQSQNVNLNMLKEKKQSAFKGYTMQQLKDYASKNGYHYNKSVRDKDTMIDIILRNEMYKEIGKAEIEGKNEKGDEEKYGIPKPKQKPKQKPPSKPRKSNINEQIERAFKQSKPAQAEASAEAPSVRSLRSFDAKVAMHPPPQQLEEEERKKLQDELDEIRRKLLGHDYLTVSQENALTKRKEALETQLGQGKKDVDLNSETIEKLGLSNIEIDKLMKKYPTYLGTFAHDEGNKILSLVEPQSIGSFIINTDSMGESKSGHWQSVFFDGKKDMAVEFYDSFGDEPDQQLMTLIKRIAEKLDAQSYLKYKFNRVQQQSDDSSNCGFFAMKFIMDRMRGKDFSSSSGYDNHIKGEKQIEQFKTKLMGGGSERFTYLPSFGEREERGGGGFFAWVNAHGDKKIRRMIVCRDPINGVVKKIINIMTLGNFNSNQKKLNYDDVYHLYIDVELEDGTRASLERNQALTAGAWREGEQKREVSGNFPTVKELVDKTIAKIGQSKFETYDAINNNCQLFVREILSANNLLSADLNAFIMQDAKSLVKGAPWFAPIARKVTDVAGVFDRLFYGRSKTPMVMQSIMFPADKYDLKAVLDFLYEHDMTSIKKPHVTDKWIHIRLRKEEKGAQYVTEKLNNGIEVVKMSV